MPQLPTHTDPWPGRRDASDSRCSWTESLASVRPGHRYRVRRVLFSLVRDACRDFGCYEGEELVCLDNNHQEVRFATGTHHDARMRRDYAWFIQVEPL